MYIIGLARLSSAIFASIHFHLWMARQNLVKIFRDGTQPSEGGGGATCPVLGGMCHSEKNLDSETWAYSWVLT